MQNKWRSDQEGRCPLCCWWDTVDRHTTTSNNDTRTARAKSILRIRRKGSDLTRERAERAHQKIPGAAAQAWRRAGGKPAATACRDQEAGHPARPFMHSEVHRLRQASFHAGTWWGTEHTDLWHASTHASWAETPHTVMQEFRVGSLASLPSRLSRRSDVHTRSHTKLVSPPTSSTALLSVSVLLLDRALRIPFVTTIGKATAAAANGCQSGMV